MKRPLFLTRTALTAAGIMALSGLPSAAITGKVVDPEGKPLADATACLMLGSAPGMCSEANEDGVFELMDSETPRMRISAPGYLSVYVPAVTHEQPIELAPGATLRIRLLDASTNEPIEEGVVVVAYPSGRRRGPFPVNRFGLVVDPLPPDDVRIVVQAPGYRAPADRSVKLTGGAESIVVIELDPAPKPDVATDGDS